MSSDRASIIRARRVSLRSSNAPLSWICIRRGRDSPARGLRDRRAISYKPHMCPKVRTDTTLLLTAEGYVVVKQIVLVDPNLAQGNVSIMFHVDRTIQDAPTVPASKAEETRAHCAASSKKPHVSMHSKVTRVFITHWNAGRPRDHTSCHLPGQWLPLPSGICRRPKLVQRSTKA